MSRWLGLVGVLVLALASSGCGGGFSPEEATSRCDQEREARTISPDSSCVDDAAYAECKSAYEECGDDVTVNYEACPVQFTCSEGDVAQEEG